MKPLFDSGASMMQLRPGQMVEPLYNANRLWRVRQGMLAVIRHEAQDWRVVRLALPGDWLNLEAACDLPAPVDIVALSACRLSATAPTNLASTADWLRQTLQQQQARTETLLRLRTGTAQDRLAHLIALMQAAQAAPRTPLLTRQRDIQLPALRWLAVLLDTTPETACRTLSKLRHRSADLPIATERAAHTRMLPPAMTAA